MIVVENEEIRRLALIEVLKHIDSGRTAKLEKGGLSKEAIMQLSAVRIQDVPALSRLLKLTLTFDPKNLNVKFSRAAALTKDELGLLEYFVRNHATPAMIRRYFRGISDNTIREMRGTFGITRIGRSPALDHKSAIQFFDTWVRLEKLIPDERQRFIAVHQEFSEWPLSALYGAINETGGNDK